MRIADAIRQAESEHEINFLLTAYLEAVRSGDKRNLAPEETTTLPIAGIDDHRKRFEQLVVELDQASKSLDDNACSVMKEALHIFGSALHRMSLLENTAKRHSPVERRRYSRGPDRHQPSPAQAFF